MEWLTSVRSSGERVNWDVSIFVLTVEVVKAEVLKGLARRVGRRAVEVCGCRKAVVKMELKCMLKRFAFLGEVN